MKTRQVYYIIIVILIVIILWYLFNNSSENFVCPQPTYTNAETIYENKIKNNTQYSSLQQPISEFINCYKNNSNLSDLSDLSGTNLIGYCHSEVRQNLHKCGKSCQKELIKGGGTLNRVLNEIGNDLENEYNEYKPCMGNLSCAKKYLIPALDELESAYKNNTTDQYILGGINNNVTCETNFFNNNLSISDAQQELKTCLNNYTKCDSKCKQEMYAMQNKYPDIQNAVNNFNISSPFVECINNY